MVYPGIKEIQIYYKQWGAFKQNLSYFFYYFNYSDIELSIFNMFGFEVCNYFYDIQICNE